MTLPEDNRSALAGWAVLVCLVIALVAVVERQALARELQTEAEILHRLASQRADQHDAHLTALSALAVADGTGRPDLFLDVAATVQRFYPRIEAVDLVALTSGEVIASTRQPLSAPVAEVIRAAARGSQGNLAVHRVSDAPSSYLLIKRSPNTDAARFGLALQIDAAGLLLSDSGFWQRSSVSYGLYLADGTQLAGTPPADRAQFAKKLGSLSQPFVLRAAIEPRLGDLFPVGPLLTAAVLTTLVYAVAVLGLRQRVRAGRAERQAMVSAQDARLAHAARVNGLGEMASGMAHELTQPLTAVLSQAQAGRHLLERGDTAGLRGALDSIIAQTRRASAILDRLRNWTRITPGTSGPVDLNDCARNVQSLLQAEADRAGIGVVMRLDPDIPTVRADPIEVEQVVFNLMRNAMEAVAGRDLRQVTVLTRATATHAVLEVSDTGPGPAPDIVPRLFEPFVTDKPQGTGLGLVLSRRLVERMEGEIGLVTGTDLTTFRIIIPVATPAAETGRT